MLHVLSYYYYYYYYVPGTRLNPVVVVSGCPLVKYSEEENPITLLVLVSAFNTLLTRAAITPGH